ncbi:MAG: hypothetical protein JW969_16855 [Spirochaetales bacterium]|nr:hypothetical protein [Spirochaetales bacterium]
MDKVFSNGPVRYRTDNGEVITDYKTSIRRDKLDGVKLYNNLEKRYYKAVFMDGSEYVLFPDNLGKNGKSLKIFRKPDNSTCYQYGQGNMSFEWPGKLQYSFQYFDNRVKIENNLINLIFHPADAAARQKGKYILALIVKRHPNAFFSLMIRDALEKNVPLDDDNASFLHAYNFFRIKSGLPESRVNEALQMSSAWHAGYLIACPGSGHEEDPNEKLYVGTTPMDRARKAGYENSNLGEVISESADPYSITDSFLHTVFHRMGVLQPEISEAGFGYGIQVEGDSSGVIDYYREKGNGPEFTVFPYPDMKSVPPGWNSNEYPNPLPVDAVFPVGFPVTVFFRSNKALPQSVLVLYDGVGSKVECFTGFGEHRAGQIAALIPRRPLKFETTYTAVYSYSRGTGKGSFKWRFTTSHKPGEFNHIAGVPDFTGLYPP